MPPRIRLALASASTTLASARTFSSSTARNGQISNIGRAPITLPPTAVLTPSTSDPSPSIQIQGPLGTTSLPLKPYIRLNFPAENTLTVGVENAQIKEQRQMWGTTRTLIHNAIVGMTEGFKLPVYLVGIGYRVAVEPDPRGKVDGNSGLRLNMKLGFSHSVFVSVPEYITIEAPSPTKLVLGCTDKHLLGLFAAKIRKWRPPEPYKGKGIFVGTEQIRIKAVKKK